MGIVMFDSANWAMPFHFWSAVFFVLGCVVGSFLNVVIHRLPLEQSIVSPPSHCPHCKYAIPWYLNVPLVTWLYLGGKCANCGAPISIRYFLVELLTGVMFLLSWLAFGHQAPAVAVVYCAFIAALIAGTFIDFEHFIIPDEITIGGTVVGFILSLLVPTLHDTESPAISFMRSVAGLAFGALLIYTVLRAGKFFFGRHKVELPGKTKIVFTENSLVMPDHEIPYDELFYRKTDFIQLDASTAELCDRCYLSVPVRLTASKLQIGDEELAPESVPYLEVQTERIILPREAMGLGDVKLMAMIGALLGWQAVVFSLMAGSVIGSVVGLAPLILKRQNPVSRLAFVPYLSMGAVLWIFGGHEWWLRLWMPGFGK